MITRTMKAFRIEEAARCGCTESAIAMRIHRGQYQMTVNRINCHNVEVIGTPIFIGSTEKSHQNKTNKLTTSQQSENLGGNMSDTPTPTKESQLSPEAKALLREEKSRGGKAGSKKDKSRAGKLGYQAKLARLEEKAKRIRERAQAEIPTPMIKVKINDKVGHVPRGTYVAAKTKQLQEFGYPSLSEQHVNEQIDALLAGKTLSNGLTVIGGFMKDEVLPE